AWPHRTASGEGSGVHQGTYSAHWKAVAIRGAQHTRAGTQIKNTSVAPKRPGQGVAARVSAHLGCDPRRRALRLSMGSGRFPAEVAIRRPRRLGAALAGGAAAALV